MEGCKSVKEEEETTVNLGTAGVQGKTRPGSAILLHEGPPHQTPNHPRRIRTSLPQRKLEEKHIIISGGTAALLFSQ